LRQARLADLCSAAGVGGPGFINLVFSPELLRPAGWRYAT
jgi:hypothetical protein